MFSSRAIALIAMIYCAAGKKCRRAAVPGRVTGYAYGVEDILLIQSITEAAPGMVHVYDPSAYEAFREGRVLFDIGQPPKGLQEFMEKNRSEFGGAFVLAGDGSFTWFKRDNRKIYVLSHRHASAEKMFKSEIMKQLAKDHPEWFE